MLDRLHVYAQRKGLVINVAKSEIVHFNSKGDNMPVFMLGGAHLACCEVRGMPRPWQNMVSTRTNSQASSLDGSSFETLVSSWRALFCPQ
eukprot:525-Pelagomonas_calceolata.AAC.2